MVWGFERLFLVEGKWETTPCSPPNQAKPPIRGKRILRNSSASLKWHPEAYPRNGGLVGNPPLFSSKPPSHPGASGLFARSKRREVLGTHGAAEPRSRGLAAGYGDARGDQGAEGAFHKCLTSYCGWLRNSISQHLRIPEMMVPLQMVAKWSRISNVHAQY